MKVIKFLKIRTYDWKSIDFRITFAFTMMVQIIELNVFFSMHIFHYPQEHWLCSGRLLLLGFSGVFAIEEYYSYLTDYKCKRLGYHAQIFTTILITELLVLLKFNDDTLNHISLISIGQWICISFLATLINANYNYITAVITGFPDDKI